MSLTNCEFQHLVEAGVKCLLKDPQVTYFSSPGSQVVTIGR
jgi:hypothetical protein